MGEVEGKIIKLTRGYEVIVDAEDYEWLSKNKWHTRVSTTGTHIYAFRATTNEEKANGLPSAVGMHRVLMGHPDRMKMVDHINSNTLDNRKSNLRVVSKMGNAQNQSKQKRCAIKFKGVTFDSRYQNYEATITPPGGRPVRLGSWRSAAEAAMDYDRAAMHMFGEFAKLNFPTAQECKVRKLEHDLESLTRELEEEKYFHKEYYEKVLVIDKKLTLATEALEKIAGAMSGGVEDISNKRRTIAYEALTKIKGGG